MKFFNAYRKYVLMDEAGNEGGSGGGGTGDDAGAALKAEIAELKSKLEALSKPPAPKTGDDDLSMIAERNRIEAEKKKGGLKALESAVQFDFKSADWLKTNESLLPKNIQGIFDAAQKETFDSVIEKTNAVKAGIIQEFFSVQDNLDLLTDSQKNNIANYLKLTKNVKQERASEIYDSLFEPTFEMLKRIKKAELINKGYDSSSDAETAYKNKMIAISKKHYLGENKDA